LDRSAGDRAAPDKEYTMDGEKLDTAEAKAYRLVCFLLKQVIPYFYNFYRLFYLLSSTTKKEENMYLVV
jgi:hypothetical protein